MNKELMKRIMIRNALFLHTPSRVGLWGSLSIIIPFQIANRYLARELSRLIPEAKDQA